MCRPDESAAPGCELGWLRGLARVLPLARTRSLHHGRGRASAREHAPAAGIPGEHRGPWRNMQVSMPRSPKRLIGRRALAGLVLWLAGFAPPADFAVAASLAWLYDVDVPVQGRTAAARLAASGTALAEVLSRVSGLAHVPRNARVRAALGDPEAYYDRFVFLDNGELRIHFSRAAILRLMDEARLPVWSSANRPQVAVWLVVERGGERRIVDGEHPLAAALSARARQRGLSLQLPLMDLEDRLRVRPAVVRGRLLSSLEEASRRYGADVILAGQVQERMCVAEAPARRPDALANAVPEEAGERLGADFRDCGPAQGSFYSVTLQAWTNGEELAAGFAVSDMAAAGSATAEFIADELAGRFAVFAREPADVSLTVRGIVSAVGYGRLLRYLGDLEFVTSVHVVSVEVDRLEVTLHTRAGMNKLMELLASDGRIRPDPGNGPVLVWRGP